MNARDTLKPKSIRVAILQALSDGAITTIDDLQTKLDEPRKKVVDNAVHASNDGLIKRLRDDVTGLAAYKITTEGKAYLVKYASGKVEAPADVVEHPKVTKPPVKLFHPATKPSEAKVDITAILNEKDAEIARIRQQYDDACALVASMHEAATGTKCGPVFGVVQDVAAIRERLIEWLAMAFRYDCETPQDIENKFSECAGIIATPNADPVGYVIQRPAKPLVRFSKSENAQARALAFARSGKRAQVFALIPVGAAVPGAEWKNA